MQPNGFNIEITNTNPGVVMVGVRILIGCQSVEKAPSFVEIFGRVIQLSLTRNRWFDLPFTREESLSADKKFSLFSRFPFACHLRSEGCAYMTCNPREQAVSEFPLAFSSN